MEIARNSTPSGMDGCRCIDTSEILESFVDRSCITSAGQVGVLLTASGPCVDNTFGSTSCLPHDWMVMPPCDGTDSHGQMPGYCHQSWCYVDAMSCTGSSSERVFGSSYFPSEPVNLFYSYSTCGSSAADWIESPENNVLGTISLTAIAPAYNLDPYVYKRDYTGNIPEVPGSEYYNNSVPYEGVYINFVRSLQGMSEGDFEVKFAHGSRASMLLHPASPGTAAVQDVADGLVDFAIAPIWITAARLKISAFTMPICQDKIMLVIPRPRTRGSLFEETSKVFGPLKLGVWILLLVVIAVTALLSVWLSGRRSTQPSVYARLAVDECLQNGMFFCSAGVQSDERSSLPRKLLMVGFGLFVLIFVSSYVANLAAFLTRAGHNGAVTMDDVIHEGIPICAHPALEKDLQLAYPNANWIFNQEGREFFGLIDDYDAGNCHVMAVSTVGPLDDLRLVDLFCQRDLVYTESFVTELPVGFPIKSELASGFSYWMYEGAIHHGISVHTLQDEYNEQFKRKPSCNLILSEQDSEDSEYTKIDMKNLLFPIVFFVVCAALAAILQLYYQRAKEGAGLVGSDLIGSRSNLNLMPRPRRRDYFRRNKERRVTFHGDENEDDDEVCDTELPQLPSAEDTATSSATRKIPPSNCDHGDATLNSRSQGTDQEVKEGTSLLSDLSDDAALSHAQQKLDEVIDFFEKIKKQNTPS